MACSRLYIFPAIMGFFLPLSMIITYGMAVYAGHVEPLFPYISDTGTVAPESCVFGQLLNLFAALTAWCMYLRYREVHQYYRMLMKHGFMSHQKRASTVQRKLHLNSVCLGVGIFCALGISIVGNFQEDNAIAIHLLGALIAFGGASVYCWMQTILSYKMSSLPQSSTRCRHVRTILSTIQTACFITMITATKLSLDKFPGTFHEIKRWNNTQPGYTEHLVATSSEWLMATASSFFFLTFVGELRKVQAKVVLMPRVSKCRTNVDKDGTGYIPPHKQRDSTTVIQTKNRIYLVDGEPLGMENELEETCSFEHCARQHEMA